jgi:hypothetical protein
MRSHDGNSHVKGDRGIRKSSNGAQKPDDTFRPGNIGSTEIPKRRTCTVDISTEAPTCKASQSSSRHAVIELSTLHRRILRTNREDHHQTRDRTVQSTTSSPTSLQTRSHVSYNTHSHSPAGYIASPLNPKYIDHHHPSTRLLTRLLSLDTTTPVHFSFFPLQVRPIPTRAVNYTLDAPKSIYTINCPRL